MKYSVFVVIANNEPDSPEYLVNEFDWPDDTTAGQRTVTEIQELTKAVADGTDVDIIDVVRFVLLFREEEVIPISFFSPESPNSLVETVLDDEKRQFFQKKLKGCLH